MYVIITHKFHYKCLSLVSQVPLPTTFWNITFLSLVILCVTPWFVFQFSWISTKAMTYKFRIVRSFNMKLMAPWGTLVAR